MAANASTNRSYSIRRHPRVPVAQVQRVVEQALPVGADVEHHRQGALRVDAARRGVHRELAQRDVHAADAPVADAQDGARVGGHDQVHVAAFEAGGQQRPLDHLGMVHGQVHAAGPPVLLAELLDGLAHRGRVDDRQHLPQVLGQHVVVQHLVAVAQLGEQHVLAQVGGLPVVLGEDPGGLLGQRHPGRRDQPGDAQRVALGLGERGALVDPRVGQDLPAAQGGPPGPVPVPPDTFHGSLPGSSWPCHRARTALIVSASAAVLSSR